MSGSHQRETISVELAAWLLPVLVSIGFDLASCASGPADPDRAKLEAVIDRVDGLVVDLRRAVPPPAVGPSAAGSWRASGHEPDGTSGPAAALLGLPSVDRAAQDLGDINGHGRSAGQNLAGD